MSDKVLFSPFELGGQTLKNRVVLAPMTRARAGPSRLPNELLVKYYEQRASAGLLISEATAVSEQAYGWRGAPGIYTSEMAKLWKVVTDRVHAKGSIIYLQLWHLGRMSHSSHHATVKETVSASAIAPPGEATTAEGKKEPYEVPRELRLDEIPGIVEQFRSGAAFAKEAGFDGVEIHSANGYLIDQFLQSASNKRTDAYGGSFENRSRILFEVIDACKSVFPANRVGFRLNPNGAISGMGSADNFEMFLYVAKQADKLGLAYLHLMDGLGFGFHGKCKAVTAADVRKLYSGPIICNISLTRDVAEGMIRSGAADLAAFGRPFLSNPDLVERFQADVPLNPDADYSAWYSTDTAAGYTDYPTHEEAKAAKSRPIAVGERLPSVVLHEYKETEGEACVIGPNPFDVAKASAGKTIVVFGVPGAFTPTCAKHVPGFIEKYSELKERGVDEIWCIGANDAFVVGAWARELKTEGKVRMLGDGNGEFARAGKLVQDLTAHGMGVRSLRYSMLVRDGKIEIVNVDAPGKFEVSDAATLLKQTAA